MLLYVILLCVYSFSGENSPDLLDNTTNLSIVATTLLSNTNTTSNVTNSTNAILNDKPIDNHIGGDNNNHLETINEINNIEFHKLVTDKALEELENVQDVKDELDRTLLVSEPLDLEAENRVEYVIKSNCNGKMLPLVTAPNLETRTTSEHLESATVGERSDIDQNHINRYPTKEIETKHEKGQEKESLNTHENNIVDIKEMVNHPVAKMLLGRKPLAYDPMDYGNHGVVNVDF